MDKAEIPPNSDILERTMVYGIIDHKKGKFFNDYEKISSNILNYRVSSIKIFYDEINQKKVISGIQFSYKVKGSSKIVSLEEHLVNNKTHLFDIFNIDYTERERLTGFHLKYENNINQIGFSTNKREGKIWFGDEGGEDMELELEKENVIIMAPFGWLGQERLSSLGMYYFKFGEYVKKRFVEVKPYFLLRHNIKKNEKTWKESVKNLKLDETNLAIEKTCELPDLLFSNIIVFLFHF